MLRSACLIVILGGLQACGGGSSSSSPTTSPSPEEVPDSPVCNGTQAQGSNLVSNGSFESSPDQVIEPGNDISGWTSEYKYVGLHPIDVLAGNEIAAFAGFLDFELVKQKAFEGDAGNNVAAAHHFVFSDGDQQILTVWSQTVSGLNVGEEYEFSAYASNALIRDWKAEPIAQLKVDGATIASSLIEYDGVDGNYVASQDQWHRLEGSFIASSSEVTLSIVDAQDGGTVNDLALTAISLKGCQ